MAGRWVLAFTLLVAPVAGAEPRSFSVEVGQRKKFPIEAAHGLILSSPRVADVDMVGGATVEVLGKAAGKATLDVWTRNGKRLQYTLDVRPGKAPAKREPTPYEVEWTEPMFGGQRIEDARCELPFKERRAGRLFDQARVLLARDEVEPAVAKLQRVIQLEPEAATAHLFLGAALAKLKSPEQGIAAFETFALSCADDPRSPAVVQILKRYQAGRTRSAREMRSAPLALRWVRGRR